MSSISRDALNQIMATIRNITIQDVTGKIIRIVPDSVDSVTAGVSRFILINTEKYTDFVSGLDEGDSVTLQLIGLIGYKLYSHSDAIFMYIHLILAALFPIFIGAHASLSQPSSAAKKAPKSREDEESDEAEASESAIETLDKSDAIMFPIIAGILLTGLYFLIKWLEDPAMLNLIMNFYFSLMGIGAIGKLVADTLNVLTTFVFPSIFFSKGKTYRIEPLLRGKYKKGQLRKFRSDGSLPLPGPLSNWKLLTRFDSQLWDLRALFTGRWVLNAYVRGFTSFKCYVRLNDAIGLALGAVAIAIYNFGGKQWVFTNLMGISFCYTALQVISLGDFFVGSLLLTGLFFYDIIMVFYTPMMVSVAKNLEVPIKLVFNGPGRGSMLGKQRAVQSSDSDADLGTF